VTQIKEYVDLDWDLTKDIECQVNTDCDQPAAWLVRTLCCGSRTTLCAEHARKAKGRAKKAQDCPSGGYHRECGASSLRVEWIEL
jgi:hypothetical protein